MLKPKQLAKAVSPELVQTVIECYADLQALYLMALGTHWNTTGAEFYSQHQLYSRLYEELDEAVDRTAEHIRYLGARVPFSPDAIAILTGVVFPNETDTSDSLHAALIAGHEVLEEVLGNALSLAQAESEGTVNLLGDELEKCGSRLYLLRSLVE